MSQYRRKLQVMFEKTKTGYSAFLTDFPVSTTGSTISHLQYNLLEAIEAYNNYVEEKNNQISYGSLDYEEYVGIEWAKWLYYPLWLIYCQVVRSRKYQLSMEAFMFSHSGQILIVISIWLNITLLLCLAVKNLFNLF